MAWFLVFGKPDCDLEFSKSNGHVSCVWLIEMCHVSQYEHFESLNHHVSHGPTIRVRVRVRVKV